MTRLVVVAIVLLGACTTASPAATQPTPQRSAEQRTAEQRTAQPDPAGSFAATPSPLAPPVSISACRAPAAPTTASTEGPYFKAGSPEKASLVSSGMSGTRIVLVGLVQTRGCAPVANAKVDIWQADANGAYDNTGYTLRGHVRTDASGKYQIETIVPARYPGRTPHIHVKVEPPGGRVLTTQLYFPNEPANASDCIFRPELTLTVTPGTPLTGTFAFVVDLP